MNHRGNSCVNEKKNIAVIFTGGTIGSKADRDGWIAPNREQPYALIELFAKKHPDISADICFSCTMPYQILSEQLDAQYLTMLIHEVQGIVKQNREQKTDAIIICHGTDTLAYSAAMLGIIFAACKIPIYLVSSNYPLADDRANGIDNFLYAIKSIEKDYYGVMVPYKNSDGNTYLHQGVKLLAHQTFEDNVFSVHQEHLGYFDLTGKWHENTLKGQENNIFPCNYTINNGSKKVNCGYGEIRLKSDTREILRLHVYPGYTWNLLPAGVRYVIVETYHSGTLCVNEDLRRYMKQAEEKGVTVYLAGLNRLTNSYETIKQYEELGLVPVLNVAPIALYCKFWLEISEW